MFAPIGGDLSPEQTEYLTDACIGMAAGIAKVEAYLDGPWWIPIVEICEERIEQNLDDRERRHMEPLNDDDYHFMEDESEEWLDAVVKSEQDVEHHERLIKALGTLTKVQRNASERARSPYEVLIAMQFVLSWRGLRVGKDRANQSIFHCMGDNVYIGRTNDLCCREK